MLYERVPGEAKSLPPPAIANKVSVWLGLVGWGTAMLHNVFKLRPAITAGVHRQVLCATIGWFIGYHIMKYENYTYARLDRDMNDYIKLHPEDFPIKDKKKFAEITEPFCPVR